MTYNFQFFSVSQNHRVAKANKRLKRTNSILFFFYSVAEISKF
jgi:hypothetical protein